MPRRAGVRFLTCTRLKHEGDWARRPVLYILFRRLLGRLSSLGVFHCGERLDIDFVGLIEQVKAARLVADRTSWRDWTRYSSGRTGSIMPPCILDSRIARRVAMRASFPPERTVAAVWSKRRSP